MLLSDDSGDEDPSFKNAGRQNSQDAFETKIHEDIIDSSIDGHEEDQTLYPTKLAGEVVTLVTIVDPSISTTGKIILQHSQVDNSGRDIATSTKVKCTFPNINIKIKKSVFSNSTDVRVTFIVESKQDKTKSGSDEGHSQKSWCSQSQRTDFPPSYCSTDVDGTCEASPQETQSSRNSLLTISITAKEAKQHCSRCKYDPAFPKDSGKEFQNKNEPRCGSSHGNCCSNDTDYPVTEESYSSYTLSDFSLLGAEQAPSEVMCTEWFVHIPPPDEFADYQENPSTSTISEDMSLIPVSEETIATASEASAKHKQHATQYLAKRTESPSFETDEKQEDNFYDFFAGGSECDQCDQAFLETYKSSRVSLNKESKGKRGQGMQFRNNSLSILQDITRPAACFEDQATRRKTFPSITGDISPCSTPTEGIDFSFAILPFSREMLPRQQGEPKKVYIKDGQTCPFGTQSCSPSRHYCSHRSSRTLSSRKSTEQDASVLPVSKIMYSLSKSDESADNVFSSTECTVSETDYKMKDETSMMTLYSQSNFNEGVNQESSVNEATDSRHQGESQAHNDFAESGFDEALDSDQYTELFEHPEEKNKHLLIHVTPPSRSQSCEHISGKNLPKSASIACMRGLESVVTDYKVSESYTAESDFRNKKRRNTLMTVVTKELEQRLIIQGGNQSIDAQQDSDLTCDNYYEDSLTLPSSDTEEQIIDEKEASCPELRDFFPSSLLLDEDSFNDDLLEMSERTSSFVSHEEKQAISELTCNEAICMKSSDKSEENSQTSLNSNVDGYLPGKEESLESSKRCDNISLLALSQPITCQVVHLTGSDTEGSKKALEKDMPCSEMDTLGKSVERGLLKPMSFKMGAAGTYEEIRSKFGLILSYTDNALMDTKTDAKSHLKFPSDLVLKDVKANDSTQEEASDRLARRRRQFKESKQYSSTGGSSITSNITEESVNSEETRSVDLGVRVENKDKGFYTETFHSASWIFRGDDMEQLRKQVFKSVTLSRLSMEQMSPVYHIQRQQVSHDKDEGKCKPLDTVKLEGAEVGADASLGKPFVFKCSPQSGNRNFYFCATSNQEMKRWLETMDRAVHPVHQNHVWVDVTRHNASLPPLAIKSPECLGLLHQMDRNKDVWVQHYSILKDGCLYFYASIRSTQALGGIYLQGYTVSEQSLSSRRSVIEVKPPSEEFNSFYLCAENLAENQRWIAALKASISKWLPLHQAIQDFMNRPLEETRM
nr:PREDICTED: uncharacterized protein LOC106703014 [Latimeria chalumnae]|eukprot:XP_014342402.1 PREDICTED: uncharacterized protein LOC106703014 [Latimeria chalumnae]